MFALWYLSLAVDEIRKRVKCPARLCSPPTAKDQSKTTPSSNAPDTPSTRPGKSADPVAKPSTVPLTPIEIPKENPVEDERLKQLESPETAELIKTFEITDPVVEKPSEPEVVSPPKPVATPSPPTPPVVVQKEEPVAPPVAEPPKKAPMTDPTESLFSQPPTQNTNPAKDLKEATTDFLAQEFNQPKKQSKRSKSETMVDAAVLQKLEDGFAKLAASDSKSLLKKYLTKEVFDSLKNKKTPTFGSTLLDVIQSGLENHDSGVGIYAPDAEAYTTFAELFDPIIEDYHGGFKKTDKHPPKNFGDVSVFGNLDPTGEFVISTRVRCGRSMEGYPFNPCLTEAQYKEMEAKVSSTLSGLEGELKGKFYPLTGMEKSVQQQLIDDHFLFKEGDRFLQAANACRYWPSGRGIYHNDAKTFLVWCNEEDHLRIISMQMGGDLGEVFRRLTTAVNDIEKRIPFSHNDRLGFLTFCPTNLGTTIRASVHIKVPKLAANKAKLEEVAAKYNLQVRGTRGEHTEAEGGVYDISNKRRMGLTEFDAVKEMYDGITEIIKIEKSL